MLSAPPGQSPCPYKVGHRIAGRYEVREYLGCGSSGWVVRVSDSALGGESVALKIIYPHLLNDAQSNARLRREIVLTRQLSHPRVVHLHDFEENREGETFVAMEFVDGIHLGKLLEDRGGKGLPFEEAVAILVQLGEALLYAHQQGIVHRDLKPSNILVGYDRKVRLCDFGLAKSFESELGLTRTGETPGSPAYMAPEQFRGLPADQRSDIYAFALIAYELVTGYPPFRDEDYFRLATKHMTEPFPIRGDRAEPVPLWFEALLARCAAKDPSDRPQSIADVLEELRQRVPHCGAVRIRMSPRSFRGLSVKALRRLAAALAILGCVLGFEWGYMQANFKTWVITQVLVAEGRLGFELRPLKWYLRIHTSLIHPETAFALVAEGKPARHELKALLLADIEVRRRNTVPWPSPVEIVDEQHFTLLQRAARMNVGELVAVFAGTAAKTSGLDPEGETILSYIVRHDLAEAVGGALELTYSNVNQLNTVSFDTALHLAVRKQNTLYLDALVGLHADPNSRDRDGKSALHVATEVRDSEHVRYFVLSGADLNVRDAKGRTPLMIAVGLPGPRNEVIALSYVLTRSVLTPSMDVDSAVVNARDNSGRTALMYAVLSGAFDVVSLLTRSDVRADTAVRDQDGMTAYDRAVARGAPPDIVELLRPPAGPVSSGLVVSEANGATP